MDRAPLEYKLQSTKTRHDDATQTATSVNITANNASGPTPRARKMTMEAMMNPKLGNRTARTDLR